MSIEQLEQAAEGLGPLRDRVAFLGGASIVLWITEPGAPQPRPTKDVDVIVEVVSHADYRLLGEELRQRGFEENPDAVQISAWLHLETRLELDVMPTEAGILGFASVWYPAALAAAVDRELPSGAHIRAVPPPHLLATKIEAFRGRGNGDYLGSHDFGDMVFLLDGRTELIDEIQAAPSELRAYLGRQFLEMSGDFAFEGGIAGSLMPDLASQARLPIVRARIQQIIDNTDTQGSLKLG